MNEIIRLLFYPVFLIAVFCLTLIFIPKIKYKEYFIYGFLIGGLGDIIVVGFMQNILGVMWFYNHGIFNVFKMMALSPLCWTANIMTYFYSKNLRYPYILTWVCIALVLGTWYII